MILVLLHKILVIPSVSKLIVTITMLVVLIILMVMLILRIRFPKQIYLWGSHGLAKGPWLVSGCVGGCRGPL